MPKPLQKRLHFGKIHFGSKKLGDGGDLLGDGGDLLGDGVNLLGIAWHCGVVQLICGALVNYHVVHQVIFYCSPVSFYSLMQV